MPESNQKPEESPHATEWQAVWDSLDWTDNRADAALADRMRQRAQQYAAPVKQRDEDSQAVYNLLLFELGAERYGIQVGCVRSVRVASKITRVPGTPGFYLGVVNVRGQITTVMDLRHFFGVTIDDGDQPPREIIIVRAHGLEIGLVAHHVEGVLSTPRSAVEPLADMRYAIGMTKTKQVVLDIEQIFQEERLIIGGTDE